MIVNGRGKRINMNINGTDSIVNTIGGNITSNGGRLISIPLAHSCSVPRPSDNINNNTGIFVHPTTPNANMVTNNTIHAILRVTNMHGILTGRLNSGGPLGGTQTTTGTLTSLHAFSRITRRHSVPIRGLCI